MSAKSRILDLFLRNVGREVDREKIRVAAGASEWVRRVRELAQEGWKITATKGGYILASSVKRKPIAVRGEISSKQRYRILKRDHSRCRRCGRTVDDGVKLVVDHIIPVEWGGHTVDENLWTLCEECNQGKKAHESDVDAEAMKKIIGMKSGRDRLRGYFKFRAGQICTREELQIVAGINDYPRRIRELREEGVNIILANARGDYRYEP